MIPGPQGKLGYLLFKYTLMKNSQNFSTLFLLLSGLSVSGAAVVTVEGVVVTFVSGNKETLELRKCDKNRRNSEKTSKIQ